MLDSSSHEVRELETFNYVFPAIRGIQSGREYYVTMCPLKLVPKLFIFDEQEVPPELRAQRILNRARIPEIANYILENQKDYTFSSITASIDGKVQFRPLGEHGKETSVGNLIVPMTSRMIINDGQHRRAAIEEALSIRPELGNESISAVFFIDAGLKRCQQMFADLNKHAVRPTKSLGILYDHRDPLSQLVKRLIEYVPVFQGRVDLDKTSISNRSLKLFTLNNVYHGTKALLGKRKKNEKITKDEEQLAIEYWSEVTKQIPEWQLLMEKKVTGAELRKDFIHAHGIAIHALGIAGHDLVTHYPNNWKAQLKKLKDLNWSRSNTRLWEGRAMIGGRVSKAQNNLVLTANLLKKTLGLSLTGSDEKIEKSHLAGMQRRR